MQLVRRLWLRLTGRELPPKPECFGVYRSGQWDAESDCETCPYDEPCMREFKHKMLYNTDRLRHYGP